MECSDPPTAKTSYRNYDEPPFLSYHYKLSNYVHEIKLRYISPRVGILAVYTALASLKKLQYGSAKQ